MTLLYSETVNSILNKKTLVFFRGIMYNIFYNK